MPRHAALFAILLLIASAFIFFASFEASAYENHEPIMINTDAIFIAQALLNGWQGTGQSNDPFIIENYEITAEDSISIPLLNASAISISNTLSYFVIKNCRLSGASSGSGIELLNVQNAEIINNSCIGNFYGISVDFDETNLILSAPSTPSIIISGNNCTSNSESGIFINCANRECPITIDKNTCNLNWVGINILDASSCVLSGNTCSYNSGNGMYLFESISNKIENNICCENGGSGIKGEGEEWAFFDFPFTSRDFEGNSINGNQCSHNTRGIEIWYASNNQISNNICEQNAKSSILAFDSAANTICDNYCSASGCGITVQGDDMFLFSFYSSEITIKNNTVKSCEKGIYLYDSVNCTVESNTCTKCEYGIYLEYTAGNVISGNTLSRNDVGIGIYFKTDWSSGETTSTSNDIIKDNYFSWNKKDVFDGTKNDSPIGMVIPIIALLSAAAVFTLKRRKPRI